MRKFRFRLESVLEHRSKEEERVQQELAEQRRVLDREKSHLQYLKSELSRYYAQLRSLQSGADTVRSVLDIRDLEYIANYIEYVREHICLQEVLIAELSVKVEEKREELVTVAKDKKVLEKLKEKQQLEHKALVGVNEQKVLDDLGSSRHWRSGNMGG